MRDGVTEEPAVIGFGLDDESQALADEDREACDDDADRGSLGDGDATVLAWARAM